MTTRVLPEPEARSREVLDAGTTVFEPSYCPRLPSRDVTAVLLSLLARRLTEHGVDSRVPDHEFLGTLLMLGY